MDNKKYYEQLAQDCMLSFTDKEIDEIGKKRRIKKEFENVLKIDTTNVNRYFIPMIFIHI
nr:hypothetical protein [Entomoplasma sp. MP1]